MRIRQSKRLMAWVLIFLAPVVIAEETGSPDAPCEGGAPSYETVALSDLLNSVAQNSDKEFLVDSRVPPQVVVGQLDWYEVDDRLLHSVLRNNGLAAATAEGRVNIVPVASIRQYPLPMVEDGDESFADDEWVRRVVRPERAKALSMVAILRPILPREGHLVAEGRSNTLLIVARYGNVRQLAEIIREMDEHTPESDDEAVTD